MDETSPSLLSALSGPAADAAWRRLVALYDPLLRGWLARYDIQPQDRDDVVQAALTKVLRHVGEFERQRAGSFRRWLKEILVNCLRDHWRALQRRPQAVGGADVRAALEQLSDPDSALSRQWDLEHDRYVSGWLLEQVRAEFTPQTWEAFRRVTLAEEPPKDVAAQLGMSVNAVHIAKSRILARVRELGRGLVD